MNTRSWKEIKEDVYCKRRTARRDEFEHDAESFKIELLLKKMLSKKTIDRIIISGFGR